MRPALPEPPEGVLHRDDRIIHKAADGDGEAAQGIKGLDPISTGQLSREEIARAEANPNHKLKLSEPKVRVPESKRKGPRYTPVSKRQDRPNAILWLVRNHPELKDAQISRLVGTTKNTIQQIRERTHWNSTNLTPMDQRLALRETIAHLEHLQLTGRLQHGDDPDTIRYRR